MKYGSEKYYRRSIRLKDYNYSQEGVYFITICTKNGVLHFEDEYIKQIAEMFWLGIPNRFPNVLLDEFVIMLNHIHGIIQIHHDNTVGAIHELPLQKQRRQMLVPKIIGYFKMNTAKQINKILNRPGQSFWQRNYYEHVIRNEDELNRIQKYIIENPIRWEFDRENPAGNPDKNEREFWKDLMGDK